MEWKQLLSPHRVGSSKPGVITQDRSPFQRDFDRIVFSGAFRRLQDKTQVFPLVKTDYVRTRLTHSLETSSVGRSLGTAVGVEICKNFDTAGAQPSDIGAAVAAAALAHDIGNPPLGHAGEEAIRYWFTHSPVACAMRDVMNEDEAADIERYEGNAQGFRVLTRLEMPDQKGGMQLTCATLAAFAKYPSASRVEVKPSGVAGKKFNFFREEQEFFAEVAEHTGMIPAGPWAWQRHPLAYLVEAADDIAYRIVDFEDGQRLGLIDYQELERVLTSELGSKEDYKREFGDTPFGLLIRKITKLDHQAAMQAFSAFINDQSLNQNQIAFVNKIIHHIELNGYMENVSELAKPPFDKPVGFIKLFDAKTRTALVQTIDQVRENATKITAS